MKVLLILNEQRPDVLAAHQRILPAPSGKGGRENGDSR